MKKPKVVVHSLLLDTPDIESEILKQIGAELVFVPNDEIERFFAEARDADGLIIADRQIPADRVAGMEQVKIIARQGIGFDNIDLAAAKQRGIAVTNVPDYCLPEVSDFAISLIFALVRNTLIYNRHVRQGIWDVHSIVQREGLPEMRRLSTQTLGLLGFGKIAQEVAKKMKVFGLRIITSDPFIPAQVVSELGAELVDLDDLLSQSDILSLHSPLTEQTHHMFNAEAFAKMKPNAVIVNTSRGPLINEADLYQALKSRQIAGAGLDVTNVEPIAQDNPLLRLDNVIITPHAAFLSQDSFIELRTRAAQEVVRVLSGQAPLHRVNP